MSSAQRVRRAVAEYAGRVVLLALLGVSFAFLLRESPPFTRLRPDLPDYGDVRMLALVITSTLLVLVPLVLPRRAAFMAATITAGVVVAFGVYEYSRIDWANIPSGGDYATGAAPTPEAIVLAGVPFVLLILYHVTRIPIALAADAKERGAPERDVRALRRGTRTNSLGAVGLTLLLWLPVAAAILTLPEYRAAVEGALGAWPRATLLAGVALLALAFGPLAWDKLRPGRGGPAQGTESTEPAEDAEDAGPRDVRDGVAG